MAICWLKNNDYISKNKILENKSSMNLLYVYILRIMYLNVLNYYILLHVFVYVKEKKIKRVIYYTVKIGFLYTLYIKLRWERERDLFRSTITHQCFSLLRSHFSARIFKFFYDDLRVWIHYKDGMLIVLIAGGMVERAEETCTGNLAWKSTPPSIPIWFVSYVGVTWLMLRPLLNASILVSIQPRVILGG